MRVHRALDELRGVSLVEAGEMHPLTFAFDGAYQFGSSWVESHLGIAIGPEDGDSGAPKIASEESQQQKRVHIRRMDVIENQQQRIVVRKTAEKIADRIEKPEPLHLRRMQSGRRLGGVWRNRVALRMGWKSSAVRL